MVFNVVMFLKREKNIVVALCIFSLIIVKSLQLRGRRQIAEPRKYCFVRVIVFFGVCFLYFLFLTSWEFGLIPYNWYQALRLGFSWSNGGGSRKGI